MQREQIGKLYGELEKYHEIISFVGLGSKSKKDIIAYLMSIDISESTSKRYVREISQGKVDLLMCDEEENVMINKDVYFEFSCLNTLYMMLNRKLYEWFTFCRYSFFNCMGNCFKQVSRKEGAEVIR